METVLDHALIFRAVVSFILLIVLLNTFTFKVEYFQRGTKRSLKSWSFRADLAMLAIAAVCVIGIVNSNRIFG